MINRFFKISSVLLVSLIVFSSAADADMTIDNFTDATNDRFSDNTGLFIGGTNNFSGVARNGRWATMISENVGLSANHAFPGDGVVLDFYPGNDPTATPVQRTVVSSQQVAGTDLRALIFDIPLPSDGSIKFYEFATEGISAMVGTPPDINIVPAGSFQDEIAFMYGISQTVRAEQSIDHAVGQNRISGYAENVPGTAAGGTDNPNNDILILEFNANTDPEYLTYESLVQSGDSGAPLFVVRNNELLLLGINTFKFSGGEFAGSGISYTGNVATELNAIIAANAVPEPSGLVLIGLGALAIAARRRRN